MRIDPSARKSRARRGVTGRKPRVDRGTRDTAGSATPMGIMRNLIENDNSEKDITKGVKKIVNILKKKHGGDTQKIYNVLENISDQMDTLEEDHTSLSENKKARIELMQNLITIKQGQFIAI